MINTTSCIAELEGHNDRVWSVGWNPSQSMLATCSGDKSVRLYSYSTDPDGELRFDLVSSIPTGHTKSVRTVSWSPSGKTFVTGSFDSTIAVWEKADDSGEWECMTTLEGHETECKGAVYSTTGALLASCSRDKSVWIWEVKPKADFECLAIFTDHQQDVKCVSWHPAEEILASGSYDNTIKLYTEDPVDDWYCFATLTGHQSTVWSIAWMPNHDYFASASDDATVRIWQRTAEFKWETVLVIKAHERCIYSVSWSRGKPRPRQSIIGWIATAGDDRSVKIWELKELSVKDGASTKQLVQEELVATLPAAHGLHDVNTVAWSTTPGMEDVFATAGDDGVTRIWRVTLV